MEKKLAVKPYKNKKVLIDKKMSLFVYAVVGIIAVVLRTLQLYNNMNFAEGRYINGGFAANYTTIWLIIGFGLIIATLVIGKSKDKVIKSCILINPWRLKYDRLSKKISIKVSIPMIIMAIFLAYDMFFEIIMVVNRNKELSTEEDPIGIFSGITGFEWFIYIIVIILIMNFISTAVNIIKGEGITGGNCFFFGLFPIWQLLRIFNMVSSDPIIGIYSEKVYIMLTAMTSSVFMLYTIRFYSGHEKKNTRLLMCIFGYVASIFAAVSSIPRYIMFFALNYTKRDGMGQPETYELGIIIMTISIIMVFWSTYVYRVMPQLQTKGKRRWAAQTVLKDMETIDPQGDEV